MLNSDNLLTVEELWVVAAISRASYYYLLNSKDKRDARESNDRVAFDIILNVYKHRKFKKGSRQNYMILRNTPNKMSLEKIRRLMRKYGLSVQLRKLTHIEKCLKQPKQVLMQKIEFKEVGRLWKKRVINNGYYLHVLWS